MLNELVKKSRSIRSFKSGTTIPHEDLIALCDTARCTPAAMNRQPLKYRIVDTPEECALLQPLTRWASSLPIKLPPVGQEPSAFIVICHDTEIAEEKPIFLYDVGIVAQTVMLAATEMGYGGCIIGSAKETDIARALSLPSHIVPRLILGLGVPAEEVVLTEAKDGEVTYYRDGQNVHHVPKRPLDEILL